MTLQSDKTLIDAIRILAVDAVQQANSGHPGFPLGAAPILYSIYKEMKHDPAQPNWSDRDRFILSGGHGSAMLYANLHLFGYPKMSLTELKQFRQLDSLTPGHPEYGHTPGVEATTGPLGAGMGMAVGMAIAEAHTAAVFNKEDLHPVDHFTFVLGGEGCFMEGLSSEVFSLAGTLKLGKLIVLMDSNQITIEGSTNLAFTENVDKRMEAYGFGTWLVEDGNDSEAICRAIREAKTDIEKPSFIRVCTTIGYGVPGIQGTAKAHGEPIGIENTKILRKQLGWPIETPFEVPTEVYEAYRIKAEAGSAQNAEWQVNFEKYRTKYPQDAVNFENQNIAKISETIFGENYLQFEAKPDASRNMSGRILNELCAKIPNLIGGSADLAPSNKSEMKDVGSFSAETPAGRNLHYGVRELGMTAIANGILLHGGLHTYISTFFVFSDYTKPMLRLSSLMGLPLICIFTHDSIGVGEDGPTHEPIEQLAMLRATPNLHVWRPADELETRIAWRSALLSEKTPTVLALTRQNLPVLGSNSDAEKGGYILDREEGTLEPQVILMASGSEVSLCLDAKKLL
ncbi:MAG: transketolase, partial [Clostridiales Family XIII bacterium]|nr:transketolase [Clostridiales Family XIII bacterium]